MSHDARLSALNITLPEALAPLANYVPYVQVGNLLFVSGQISAGPDGLIKGRLGEDMDAAAGAAAARRCGLALLAQARAAVSSNALPRGVAVEIEAIFEVA